MNFKENEEQIPTNGVFEIFAGVSLDGVDGDSAGEPNNPRDTLLKC